MKSASSVSRPRFWVPGTLFVRSDGELEAGAHVGFNGTGRAFSGSACGHASGLQDWRHTVWLVRRSDLDPEIIDQHAILLPETLIDRDRQPYARRWLEELPLVCVSGTKVERLVDGGLRVFTVSHGAEGDDDFVASAVGGEGAGWSLKAPFASLLPAELRANSNDEAARSWWKSDRLEVRSFADRLLAAVSGGALREQAVLNALAARELIEPGYGYRGATYGTAAAVEQVAHAVRALELLFQQVFDRARAQESEAKVIAEAVRDARSEEVIAELPIYETARRVALAEIELKLSRGVYRHAGDGFPHVVLAAESRWFLERVTDWNPQLPERLEADLQTELAEVGGPPNWLVTSLIGVLLAIIAVGYVMTRG